MIQSRRNWFTSTYDVNLMNAKLSQVKTTKDGRWQHNSCTTQIVQRYRLQLPISHFISIFSIKLAAAVDLAVGFERAEQAEAA